MPYYRKRKRYGRRYKKKPWYQKKYSAFQLARKAYSGIRYLKGLVNSEVFKHDVINTTSVSTTGIVVHLTGIAQGDGDSTRTGNSIFVRSVFGRFFVYQNTANLLTQFRIFIVRDKQQIGDTLPTLANILDDVGPNSPLNNETVGRFTILWSKEFTMDDSKSLTKLLKCNIPMRSHVRYNGTAGTDQQKGGLYLCAVSNQAVSPPSINYDTRVSYHDN